MSDPMQEFLTNRGARTVDGSGRAQVLDYGDAQAEAAALREGYGLYPRPGWGVIALRGPEAAEFLAGLTTNDVNRLQPGQVQPDLLCGNKGKILYPLNVLRTGPEQLLVIAAGELLEGVAGHLEAYHIREAVEMGRVELLRLDVIGPQGEAALEALGHSTSDPIGTFQEAPVLTPSLPLGALPRVMVLLPAALGPSWAEALLQTAPEGRLVGSTAFEEERIRAGVARFGVDYGPEHLPAEAALYNRLSFSKGCYIGQEVHARLHHRGQVNRKLTALEIPPDVASQLAAGQPLYADDTSVGEITSLGRDPIDGAMRGIAMVRYQQLTERTSLSAAPSAPPVIRLLPLATDLGAANS